MGLTCEFCGVAKRMLYDPPLDIPYRPRLTRTPAFWLSLVWAVVAVGGALLFLSPTARGTLGYVFLAGQVVGSAGAAVSSFFTALWQRIFNEVELIVPQQVKAGEPLHVGLRLVPYEHVEGVSVTLRLIDRFYKESRDGNVETAQQRLDAVMPLTRAKLPGRRLTQLEGEFVAPFPMTPHVSPSAELSASVLGFLSYIVPSLAWQAKNLREHGGYYVEAEVRVGFLSRRYHKRVFTYFVGADLFIG